MWGHKSEIKIIEEFKTIKVVRCEPCVVSRQKWNYKLFIKDSVVFNLLVFITIIVNNSIFAVDNIVGLSKSGMNAQEYLRELNMENVVNAKTPGFRAIRLRQIYNEKTQKILLVKKNSFLIGPLVNTARNLDFALVHKGWFVVSDVNGKMYFTRDGRFEVNQNFKLVTVSGKFRVLNQEFSPIELPAFQALRVDKQGNLYDSENLFIDTIGVFDVEDTSNLQSLNNVFFSLKDSDPRKIITPENIVIRQGYYEGSNVNYMKMVNAMADTTKYSAQTNVVQTRLRMLDTLIDIVQQN